MFSHVMVGSNDIAKSKTFYDAILGALGGAPGKIDPKGRVAYRADGSMMIITKPIDGAPATAANGGTIGFKADSPAAADAWHKAGVENGGTTCEDPPGAREGYYLAYLRDPDGNKLCALHRPA